MYRIKYNMHKKYLGNVYTHCVGHIQTLICFMNDKTTQIP